MGVCLRVFPVTQVSSEMSRAETIESVGETGGMRNSTFSQHTCCMELPRPFQTWPGLLTTTTITTGSGAGSDPMHLHHNRHNLHSLQAVYLSYPLSYLQQEDQDEHQTNQQLPTLAPSPRAPLLPLCNRMDERGEGFSEERCGKMVLFSSNQIKSGLPGL